MFGRTVVNRHTGGLRQLSPRRGEAIAQRQHVPFNNSLWTQTRDGSLKSIESPDRNGQHLISSLVRRETCPPCTPCLYVRLQCAVSHSQGRHIKGPPGAFAPPSARRNASPAVSHNPWARQCRYCHVRAISTTITARVMSSIRKDGLNVLYVHFCSMILSYETTRVMAWRTYEPCANGSTTSRYTVHGIRTFAGTARKSPLLRKRW